MKITDVDNWSRRVCRQWLGRYGYDVDPDSDLPGLRAQIRDHLVENRAYLLNDAVFTPQENDIRAAVKRLMEATGGEIILSADPKTGVCVIPVVLDDGMVEYQVSDGMPGRRSRSSDFYILAEAMALFHKVRRDGWH